MTTRTRARTGPYDHANAELRQALHEWADAEARKHRRTLEQPA